MLINKMLMYVMQYNTELSKKQKEAVYLLSLGTFLEYFDLMLYVHMSLLLNEIFFPQVDPLTTRLTTIFTFCSTFILRPVGGFVVGWVGDHIGRKNTVAITTIIMAVCCVVMATLRPYAEIGIIASFTVIFCRMLQGFTSMGEILGAQLYIVESLKTPYSYVCTSILNIQSKLGGSFALLVSYISTSVAFEWRVAFWIGAVIAVIGVLARTRLRETPEFVDYKRRVRIQTELNKQYNTELNKQDNNVLLNSHISKEKVDKKTIYCYFMMHLPFGIFFYIAYIYSATIMKLNLGMTNQGIIAQNLRVSVLLVIFLLSILPFLKKFHPIRLAKINVLFSSVALLFIPHLFKITNNLISLTILQLLILLFEIVANPTEITCFKHIPISRRFKILGITFGVSGVIGYGFTPFILELSRDFLNHHAIWIICFPVLILYWYSIKYIEKLEKNAGKYDNYPYADLVAPDTASDEIKCNYELAEEYTPYKSKCEFSNSLLTKLVNLNDISKKKINLKLVEKAIIFAKKWHSDQSRKTGEPFYSHPLAVAEIASEYYFKTDVIIAAILHDVIEDTKCTVETIRRNFNSRIAEIVKRLTRIEFDDDKSTKIPFDDVIAELIKLNDNEALFIKQIDRIHNLITIEGLTPEKQKRMANESNNILFGTIGFVFEKLNIYDKFRIENKLSSLIKSVFTKK